MGALGVSLSARRFASPIYREIAVWRVTGGLAGAHTPAMSACLAIAPELPVEAREAMYLRDAGHRTALWALASQHLRPLHDAPGFASAHHL